MRSNEVAPAWAGALAGIVAGAVALGVAQLVAGLVRPGAFPVVAVGDWVVDLSPAPLKEFAIRTFGEDDKTVLVGGVLVVLALFAAAVGVAARHRPAYGTAGVAAFGVIGLAAVLTRPAATAVDALPTLLGVLAGAWTLSRLLNRALTETPVTTSAYVGGPASASSGLRAPASTSALTDTTSADTDAGPRASAATDGATSVSTSTSTTTGTSSQPSTGTSSSPSADTSRQPSTGTSVPTSTGTSVPASTGTSGPQLPAVMRAPGVAYVFDRRRLLTGAAGGVVAAGAAAFLGRSFGGAAAVDEARISVTLPAAAEKAKPLPAGADFKINGLSSFVTPNRDFYRVDTALIVPQVDPRSWTLRVHGLVDRPIEITFDDLLKRPLVEADVTLTCVSNEVGGPYAGNARWLGVRMADVLREAGLRPEADMLLSTSQDGFTCGTPVDVVMDGRDALFAVGMNGEPLPVDHGFPVRQVVPGLYGYVSATKWVVDVKVTRFDADEAYWTPRGWAARGPIKTQSRIDVPGAGTTVRPGRTTIAGVAWAQHKGVDAVEVRVDRGAWQQARLAEVPGPDTWRQWALDWDATPGDHTIEVRATDATGYTQTADRAPVAPDGATGWHTIEVHVG